MIQDHRAQAPVISFVYSFFQVTVILQDVHKLREVFLAVLMLLARPTVSLGEIFQNSPPPTQ